MHSGAQRKKGACLGWVYSRCCLQLTESHSGAVPAVVSCRLSLAAPHLCHCRLVTDHPFLLNVESMKRAMANAKSVMGQSLDVVDVIRRDPTTILQFQDSRGTDDLIPYDDPYTPQG